MVSKLLNAIKSHDMILPGMRICVCLSGGADSCALLNCLVNLKEKFHFDLVACHFNHHIRSNEADRDEQFCISLCDVLGIVLYLGGADVPSMHKKDGGTLEEVARNARYAWFESLAELHSIDRFATAHHINDQAETVLFRFLRGTSPIGLSGISPVRGKYIRPLIDVSKNEINAYIKEHHLSYVEDSSNVDLKYTRNYIRHILIPNIENINPNAAEAISRVSNLISEDNNLIESLMPPYSDKQYVRELHDSFLRRVIYRNYFKKTKAVLSYKHLDKIFLAIKEHKNFCYEINREWNAICCDDILTFEKRCNRTVQADIEGILSVGESFEHGDVLRIALEDASEAESQNPKSVFPKNVYNLSTELLLSSDKICGEVRYRTRQPGDRILFKGHHRNIKKMMCDLKIPVSIRSYIPIVYDDEGILCVPFLGVSDRAYCPQQNNALILQVEITHGYN